MPNKSASTQTVTVNPMFKLLLWINAVLCIATFATMIWISTVPDPISKATERLLNACEHVFTLTAGAFIGLLGGQGPRVDRRPTRRPWPTPTACARTSARPGLRRTLYPITPRPILNSAFHGGMHQPRATRWAATATTTARKAFRALVAIAINSVFRTPTKSTGLSVAVASARAAIVPCGRSSRPLPTSPNSSGSGGQHDPKRSLSPVSALVPR